jgi:hypothetical protein
MLHRAKGYQHMHLMQMTQLLLLLPSLLLLQIQQRSTTWTTDGHNATRPPSNRTSSH